MIARCLARRPLAYRETGVDVANAGEGSAVEKVRVEHAPGSLGLLWFAGWLFTIGFMHLAFWKGVLAVVLWPYYLGVTFSSLPH